MTSRLGVWVDVYNVDREVPLMAHCSFSYITHEAEGYMYM